MKTKRFFCLLFSFLLVVGCLAMPTSAAVTSEPESEVITRATGRFEASIPANSIVTVGDSFILDSRDIVSYDCTYNPRSASIKFGYIGPDGYFYGVGGSGGSIEQSIRVGQRGTYTLAIWNESDETVTVKGSVNY